MKSIHLDSKTELANRYEKMRLVRVFGERMELREKELIQLAIGGNNDGK
jgi:hypothetical protein